MNGRRSSVCVRGAVAAASTIVLLVAGCGRGAGNGSPSGAGSSSVSADEHGSTTSRDNAAATVVSTTSSPTTTIAPTTSIAPTTTIGPVQSSVVTLAPGPLAPRISAATAIVDDLLVVYGGASAGVSLDDGATYDPSTDTWQVIGSSNGLAAGATTALARGGAVVLAGPDAVAQLDVASGEWTVLESNPFPRGRLFSTSTTLISVEDMYPTSGLRAASLDLDAGVWRDLPVVPASSVFEVVDLGGRLVVVSGPLTDPMGRAALILEGSTWRDLAMPPRVWMFGSVSVTAGTELMVWGGQAGVPGAAPQPGLAYSASDGSWREIEALPASWWECYASAVAIVDQVLLDVCGVTTSYDIAHDAIRTLGALSGDELTPASWRQLDGALVRWGERYCYGDCEEPLVMLFQRWDP